MGYGTGIVMGVPYGDQRDFEFAKKYDLPIVPVVDPHRDDIDINDLAKQLKNKCAAGGTCKDGRIELQAITKV